MTDEPRPPDQEPVVPPPPPPAMRSAPPPTDPQQRARNLRDYLLGLCGIIAVGVLALLGVMLTELPSPEGYVAAFVAFLSFMGFLVALILKRPFIALGLVTPLGLVFIAGIIGLLFLVGSCLTGGFPL